MEDILDLYAEPFDPARPVICFDEGPYQLVSETRLPLPMPNGKPQRYDFEYRRAGTCNLFMFLQPLAGWRHVKVTQRRTKQDFAGCMNDLVEDHFPQAETIRVVLLPERIFANRAAYPRAKPRSSAITQYGGAVLQSG